MSIKHFVAAVFGTMALSTVSASASAYSDLPKWEASLTTFTHTLRPGVNLVALKGMAGSVVVEKHGETLYAWATSGETRRALPDGSYPFLRSGITACDVTAGIVAACR